MHILKCFAEGFGLLAGGIITFALFIWALAKLHKLIINRTGWDGENTGLAMAGVVTFLVIGTLFSLNICGILK